MGLDGEWDDLEIGGPSVIYDNGIIKMWYAGHDGVNQRIGYANSTGDFELKPDIELSHSIVTFGNLQIGS